MISAEKSDLFDVLAYIAFALAPITRKERVETHKERIFSDYDEKLQSFLDFVPVGKMRRVEIHISEIEESP